MLAALLGVVLLGAAPAREAASRTSVAPPMPALTWVHPETPPKLEGNLVLLEFWATWCAPCIRGMPELQRIHEKYSDHGVTVLAVTDEKPEVVKEFLAEHPDFTFPVAIEPTGALRTAWRVTGLPAAFLVGRDGTVLTYDAFAPESSILAADPSLADLPATPVDAQLISRALTERRWQTLLGAIAIGSAEPHFDAALRDKKFRRWAAARAEAERNVARRALLFQGWVLLARDMAKASKPFNAAGVSGFKTDPQSRRVIGGSIEGRFVTADNASVHAERALRLALAAEAVAERRLPDAKTLDADVIRETERTLEMLRDDFGPEPEPAR